MKGLAWERVVDGTHAQLLESKPTRVPGATLLLLAEEKMQGILLISARFGGQFVLFQKLLDVYIDKGNDAEYLGIYASEAYFSENEEGVREEAQSNIPQNEVQPPPVFCLRRATWDKKKDAHYFWAAENKKTYVMSEQQIDSRIQFFSEEPAFATMLQELRLTIQEGIAVTPVERESPFSMLTFQLQERMDFSLSYVLSKYECANLERWLQRWRQWISTIAYTAGSLPDHGCTVSYGRSVFEIIESFPEKAAPPRWMRQSGTGSPSQEPEG